MTRKSTQVTSLTHARRSAHYLYMTQQMATAGTVPQLTLGWRLKMALEAGDVSALAMAKHLGVTRQTISRWMADNGKPPNRAYLLEWAAATGVPFEWINTGEVVSGGDGDGGGSAPTPGYPSLLWWQVPQVPNMPILLRNVPIPAHTWRAAA